MEDSSDHIAVMDLNVLAQEPVQEPDNRPSEETPAPKAMGNDSETLFPESPVYEPEDEFEYKDENVLASEDKAANPPDPKDDPPPIIKRKHSEEVSDSNSKIQKLDIKDEEFAMNSLLDDEVSKLTEKHKLDDTVPSTSRILTPLRSSPRRITKRSNSSDLVKQKTPKNPKSRSASADITSKVKTSRRMKFEKIKAIPVVKEIKISPKETEEILHTIKVKENQEKQSPPPSIIPKAITEDSTDMNDSQDFHLELPPSPVDDTCEVKNNSNISDTLVENKNVMETTEAKVEKSQMESYNTSDQSINHFQLAPKESRGKTTDQESTDSVCSISPDYVPSVASKLISKLSNGNSSTPTETEIERKARMDDSDNTPDTLKLSKHKGKKGKNESFRVSNTTTPSTISPLPNGHSLPVNTPQNPIFDVHISNNEDGEFLSLYIVRTDNDIGIDMCKEYQRFSKRFTIDPYMADVSVSNSPSSVTSGGMITLPNRTSFASTVNSLSTTSSNRTSDGAFVVPQAPRKSVSNPTTSVKGYDALMKKLQEVFSHIREFSLDDPNRFSNEDKVSVAVQVASSDMSALSNGNASPEEVSKCDKATPKSSLKKTRVRGRRHMAGKTKRALLPTQTEEPEFMHGMNSPEMVPMNGDSDKSPIKSPTEEKPLSSLVATPKSVSKLKQKRRANSPRPATPVEKTPAKAEYPGYAPDTAVLAKWVDRRYYSGRVLEITEPNKYLIKFDDGQSKVLLDDFIIFGDTKTLPLHGQSVYAMVDEDQNYEPGLVVGVEENSSGTVTYKCTTDGDNLVMVTASELYLTEDQAKSLKESARPNSPSTPRRRHNRELDLDNIIQGPRSARSRDKGSSSARKRVVSPKSPKASTSGVTRPKIAGTTPTPLSRKRVASESSEMSESSNSAPPVRIEEVPGVEPEVQKTPRKIDGVKAGPLQLKGAAKQNIGKKNSKLTKFENDADTVTMLGPIPSGRNMFDGLHFLLTCAETPKKRANAEKDTRHYSSEEDGETTGNNGTDTEDLEFSHRPFNKERLKEQLESCGGIVHSHFDDVPKAKYSSCRLIAPRPCLTAKYIQCLAADIRSVTHDWVIMSCINNRLLDISPFVLPAGFSELKQQFMNWVPPSGKRTPFFKDKIIILCGDQDTFVKFWERVCTLVGATTRVVNEEDLNMSGALALVTEWDCPHEVQNKANQDNIPLVSTTWVVQCLIEAKILPPTSHEKFSFMYTEPE